MRLPRNITLHFTLNVIHSHIDNPGTFFASSTICQRAAVVKMRMELI